MRFQFEVHYMELGKPASLQTSDKYKLINARTAAQAVAKFKKKFPDLHPVYVWNEHSSEII